MLLLDLSKAFDSVCHDFLLRKCEEMKIYQFWFADYLCDRVRSVKIGDCISTPRKISFCVPLGSILGPILFRIYINDMSEVLRKYFLIQYADDLQIILSGKVNEVNDLVQRERKP